MNKPSYAVADRSGTFNSTRSYAVEEHYEGEAPRVCMAGHSTRIVAEASAAALQGAIERFAKRQSAEYIHMIVRILEDHNLWHEGEYTLPNGDKLTRLT